MSGEQEPPGMWPQQPDKGKGKALIDSFPYEEPSNFSSDSFHAAEDYAVDDFESLPCVSSIALVIVGRFRIDILAQTLNAPNSLSLDFEDHNRGYPNFNPNDFTGETYYSTTGSGPYFSPLDLSQNSFTQASGSVPENWMRQEPVASSSRAPIGAGWLDENLLQQPNISEGILSHLRYNPERSGMINLSDDQDEILQWWRSVCVRRQKPPDEEDIKCIAGLTKLSFQYVRAWFDAKLRLGPISKRLARPIEQPSRSEVDSQESVIADVREYSSIRNQQPCENGQSKKAQTNKRYKCTLGCGFSTDTYDSFVRHIRTKFPQEFWHCLLCRNSNKRPYICHRKDKFFPHLQCSHASESPARFEELREASKVSFQPEFPSECPFHNIYGGCSYRPSSWDDYLRHCNEHFRDCIRDGPWTLRFNHMRRFDDDKDQGGPDPTSSGGFTTSSWQILSMNPSTNKTSGNNYSKDTKTNCQGQNGCSQKADVGDTGLYCIEMRDAEVPERSEESDEFEHNSCWLINVEHNKLVKAPQNPKYVALDYSWAIRTVHCDPPCSKSLSDDTWCAQCATTIFRNAIALTKDMGYQYLWIDKICSSENHDRASILEKAVMSIFIGSSCESPDGIMFFTCQYKNMRTVLDWTDQKEVSAFSFQHIRILGHGAFGIVDEVQLRSTKQSFARKTYLRWKGRNVEDSIPLQELEMLQKLNHDNITKFVAAYFHSHSLNILMLPIADCDLKEFLNEPWRWPEKRPHLSNWFLPLASALSYMHSVSCRHKDIKPANVLIKDNEVFLSDFGTSTDFSSLSFSRSHGGGIMTPKYCAPEVALRQWRGRKADVFSLGCVFVEMITVMFNVPLKHLDQHLGFGKGFETRHAIYSQHLQKLKSWIKKLRSHVSSLYHTTILDTCKRMIRLDPSRRPSAMEVYDILGWGNFKVALSFRYATDEKQKSLRPPSVEGKTQLVFASNGRDPHGGHLDTISNGPIINRNSVESRWLESFNIIRDRKFDSITEPLLAFIRLSSQFNEASLTDTGNVKQSNQYAASWMDFSLFQEPTPTPTQIADTRLNLRGISRGEKQWRKHNVINLSRMEGSRQRYWIIIDGIDWNGFEHQGHCVMHHFEDYEASHISVILASLGEVLFIVVITTWSASGVRNKQSGLCWQTSFEMEAVSFRRGSLPSLTTTNMSKGGRISLLRVFVSGRIVFGILLESVEEPDMSCRSNFTRPQRNMCPSNFVSSTKSLERVKDSIFKMDALLLPSLCQRVPLSLQDLRPSGIYEAVERWLLTKLSMTSIPLSILKWRLDRFHHYRQALTRLWMIRRKSYLTSTNDDNRLKRLLNLPDNHRGMMWRYVKPTDDLVGALKRRLRVYFILSKFQGPRLHSSRAQSVRGVELELDKRKSKLSVATLSNK